jgi:hypothetical protein
MSLQDCIRKFGKALSSKDADIVQTLADDFEASGMLRQEAEQKAIEQHLTALQNEVDAMTPTELEQANKHGYEGVDEQEAQRWNDAVAKGLDMSPEARKQRAKEQGYDVDTKLYHGTSADIKDGFIPSTVGNLGGGVYFTPSADMASTRAEVSKFRNRDKGTAPNVLPVFIKKDLNFLDLNENPFTNLDTNKLKSQGYDGVRRFENGELQEVNVFDPSQVRSVHAVFDPDEQGSANLLAQSNSQTPRGTTLMNPDAPVISLTAASDMSTFLHETMHLFMLMEQQFAKEFGISKNQRALLDSVGAATFEDLTELQHEQLAESFEVYLREGKAPSTSLMDAFNTFRAWLLQVYQSIMQRPNSILNDDLRAVFDRLLATEEEIQKMAANPAFTQMFRTKEQAGMTDEQWKTYLEAKEKRDARAITTIEQKIINELRRRKTKEWKQERDQMAEEELARLSETRVYKILADTLKRTDNHLERPLDRESIKSILGVKNVTGAWIRRTSNDGTDPQLVSEYHGYETVEDMVRELNEAKPIKEAAAEIAESRMKKKYGDILNDGTLEVEVMTALHNVKDVDKLYAELRAIDSTQTLNRDLVKAEARRIIGTMKNSDIRPGKFHQNMIRAAQRAVTAKTKEEKVLAKQQQLVNHYLYKEAVKAKKDVDKYIKYVNRVKEKEYSTRLVAPEYVQHMKMLANLYTSKSETTQANIDKLIRFYETQEAALTGATMLDPQLIAAVAAAKDGTFTPIMMKDMTVSELNGLYMSLKNLRFVGGKMSEERAETFRAKVAGLVDSVKNAKVHTLIPKIGKDKPVVTQVGKGPFSGIGKVAESFAGALPSLRNYIRKLDGGDEHGEAFKQIYLLTENGENTKLRLHRELYDRYEAEIAKIDQVSLKRYGGKKITLESGEVVNITGEARLMMALYWGTESSRVALKEGHRMTDNDAMRIFSDMSRPELELVNAIWRLNESLWPDAVAARVARTGVAPEKLAPTPFVVNGVAMTGGHMSLYYERDASGADQISNLGPGEFDSLVTSEAKTMKERVGSGGQKVLIDKGNITRSINDTIHYTAFANISVELAKIMNDKAFKDAVIKKHGVEFFNGMVKVLRNTVTGKRDREGQQELATATRYFRRNLTAMYLMYSIRNAVQQFTSLFTAAEEVGTVQFIKSAIDYMIPGNKHSEFVDKQSEYMRNRSMVVNREAHEQLHNIAFGGKATRAFKTINDYGFFMQTTIDSLIAYPVWKARYEKSISEHGDHRMAVSDADTAVAESVGSGSDLHLGHMFQSTNTEFVKGITQFGSWYNGYYQRVYRGRVRGDKMAVFRSLTTTIAMIGIASALLTMDIPGEEEQEDLALWFATKWAGQLAGMFPFFREIFAFLQDFNKKGIIQGAASAPDVILEEIVLKDGELNAGRVLGAAGLLVPIQGAGQVKRVLEFIESNSQGNEDSPFKYGQMFVEGKQGNK